MSKLGRFARHTAAPWPNLAKSLASAYRPFSATANKKVRMTTEEAFVKMMQKRGIDNAFGIIGSAMMPISDLFPAAGVKFWDCAHEYTAGMMADGFTRSTGRMSVLIGQNGPGVSNYVTPVKTAYWN